MWINCNDRLPNEYERVLIYLPEQYNKNNRISCAYIIKGISLEERESLRLKNDPRANVITRGDEYNNNHKPYRWIGDGHMEWFGQEVTDWQPLPAFPR